MYILKMRNLLLQTMLLLCIVQVASACLECFTSPADRAKICQIAVQRGNREPELCLQQLHKGFEPLKNVSIPFTDLDKLRSYLKTFRSEIEKINQATPEAWNDQFDNKMAEQVRTILESIESTPVPPCMPPCGFQKAARTFSCDLCADVDCKLPVTCPIEDLHMLDGEKLNLDCRGPFRFPESVHAVWRFAKKRKSKDLEYFKDIYSGPDISAHFMFTNVQHTGTYTCDIVDEDDDLILRKFIYLEVTHRYKDTKFPQQKERMLSSQAVKKKEKKRLTEEGPEKESIFNSYISYAVYAALGSLMAVLLIGFFAHYALNVDWDEERIRRLL